MSSPSFVTRFNECSELRSFPLRQSFFLALLVVWMACRFIPLGFLEIDFVVHGGGSTAGEILHSLVATDVCSGWTEAVALIAREQTMVAEGLKQIQEQMPVPVLGINSDNDSAFINDTLIEFCQEQGITLTRTRVHHKNDQAWVEQKNGAIIRKIIGHKRFSGLAAGQIKANLFQAVRLYVNFFQPSFKLRNRT